MFRSFKHKKTQSLYYRVSYIKNSQYKLYGVSPPLPLQNFQDYPYLFDTLKFHFIFMKKERNMISNDYMEPFPNLSFVKKKKKRIKHEYDRDWRTRFKMYVKGYNWVIYFSRK